MRCQNCGNRIEDGLQVCNICGAHQKKRHAEDFDRVERVSSYLSREQESETHAKETKRSSTVALIVAIVAVFSAIAVVVIALLAFYRSKENTLDSTTDEDTVSASVTVETTETADMPIEDPIIEETAAIDEAIDQLYIEYEDAVSFIDKKQYLDTLTALTLEKQSILQSLSLESELECDDELQAVEEELAVLFGYYDSISLEFEDCADTVEYVDYLNDLENEASNDIYRILANREDGQSFDGYLASPLSGGYYIGADYGQMTLYGQDYYHLGIDLYAPMGSPIYSSAGGCVVDCGYNFAYGNYIVIDHNNTATVYAHCLQTFVETGDIIDRNTLIAEVGSTGSATGPHLHFEVRVNGLTTQPRNYISF